MGHIVSHCDVLDILEESATSKRPVAVELEGGRSFTDQVTDVVTESGEDYVDFRDHGRLFVKDIRSAARGEPVEPTYQGKPVRRSNGHHG